MAELKTKNLRQTRTFNARASDLYEAIMDSRKHSQFTGSKSKVSTKVGGSFTASDGYIQGINLELVPNRKIVQNWRGSDWPAEHYSKATFSLSPAGRSKTKLTFTQTGIPAAQFESIKQGWIEYYWKPLEEWLKR